MMSRYDYRNAYLQGSCLGTEGKSSRKVSVSNQTVISRTQMVGLLHHLQIYIITIEIIIETPKTYQKVFLLAIDSIILSS